jgi:hypothetical protein
MTTTIDAAQAAAPDLSQGRLYTMRVGSLLMGVGLAHTGSWVPHRWNRRLAARPPPPDSIPAL